MIIELSIVGIGVLGLGWKLSELYYDGQKRARIQRGALIEPMEDAQRDKKMSSDPLSEMISENLRKSTFSSELYKVIKSIRDFAKGLIPFQDYDMKEKTDYSSRPDALCNISDEPTEGDALKSRGKAKKR